MKFESQYIIQLILWNLVFSIPLMAQISSPDILYQGHGYISEAKSVDVNGDGLEDLIVRKESRNTIAAESERVGLFIYYASDESGLITYSEFDHVYTKEIGEFWTVDYDNDGDLDFVVRNFFCEGCLLYSIAINENGQFTALDSVLPEFVNNNSGNVILDIVDLNSDGYPDLMINNSSDLHYAIQDPSGQFTIDTITHFPYSDLIYADLNNDGFTDVLAEWAFKDKLYMYLSDNSLEYDTTVIDDNYQGTSNFQLVTDFEADGEMEIYLLNQ